jgi:hypothetical protein
MGKKKMAYLFDIYFSSAKIKKHKVETVLPHCTISPTAHFTEEMTAGLLISKSRPSNWMNCSVY